MMREKTIRLTNKKIRLVVLAGSVFLSISCLYRSGSIQKRDIQNRGTISVSTYCVYRASHTGVDSCLEHSLVRVNGSAYAPPKGEDWFHCAASSNRDVAAFVCCTHTASDLTKGASYLLWQSGKAVNTVKFSNGQCQWPKWTTDSKAFLLLEPELDWVWASAITGELKRFKVDVTDLKVKYDDQYHIEVLDDCPDRSCFLWRRIDYGQWVEDPERYEVYLDYRITSLTPPFKNISAFRKGPFFPRSVPGAWDFKSLHWNRLPNGQWSAQTEELAPAKIVAADINGTTN